jgi:hypothetical protein
LKKQRARVLKENAVLAMEKKVAGAETAEVEIKVEEDKREI